jgi:aspartyl-tRNA(Asn)/glutamyl-tRNA(Gln) amidotransferase subunit A
MADSDVLFATVGELGRLLRTKRISSVELTRLYLDRLARQGRALNAVAELTEERALRQAKVADKDLASGQRRGPLHGIPYGAKDLLATQGIPTQWGSPAHRDQVFDYDATVIERLDAAGAVLVAKLSMIELAGAGGFDTLSASANGPGRNPYDPKRWAGGSSSGPGSATGGGMVGFAVASETWGSILEPSAFCNVTGLRPTYGRASRYGAMTVSWTMDKIGPMARSAEDCGVLLAAIAGPDPKDRSSAPEKFRFRPRRSRRRCRIGILPQNYQSDEAQFTEGRFDDALETFRRLGYATKEAKLPDFPYDLAAGTIITVEASSSFENFVRSSRLNELISASQKNGLMMGLAIPAADYLQAMRVRALAGPAAVRIFEEFDALAAPTLHIEAPLIDKGFKDSPPSGGNGGPTNLLGWPSITVPMGTGKAGMPLGMELIGAPYREDVLLEIAMEYQRETDWHRSRPPSQE